ncbi:single-stranded DNA-binding protein [Leuconostoc citreum]|uniref:single-stranded DNA-binding protein n=1 Tax=Leuconostoc citreum TaxID=33964 RepID=UPI0032DF47D7
MQINHHVGRLSKPVRYFLRGEKKTPIVYFTLAINDLPNRKATFIDYVAFNKTAEVINKYVNQVGGVVEVTFNMRNHNYTDPKTNQKVYEVQNVVTEFRIYPTQKESQKIEEYVLAQSVVPAELPVENYPEYPNFGTDDFSYVEG